MKLMVFRSQINLSIHIYQLPFWLLKDIRLYKVATAHLQNNTTTHHTWEIIYLYFTYSYTLPICSTNIISVYLNQLVDKYIYLTFVTSTRYGALNIYQK